MATLVPTPPAAGGGGNAGGGGGAGDGGWQPMVVTVVFTTGAEPSTSLYTNTFSPVSQGIPTGGVYDSANANTTGEQGNTPTFAFVVIGVICGLVALLLLWFLYRKVWSKTHRSKAPPLEEEKDSSLYRPQSALYLLGGGGQTSSALHSVASRGSMNKLDSTYTRHSQNFDSEELASPITSPNLGPDHSIYSTNYLRTNARNMSSDRRSMMSIHSAASSLPSQPARAQPARAHRLSGAPHSQFSRVEIVPPKPLAGQYQNNVVSLDKQTLNFSAKSGIGSDHEDLFDPESVMPNKEFEAAKAAYLSGSDRRSWSPQPSSDYSSPGHSRSQSQVESQNLHPASQRFHNRSPSSDGGMSRQTDSIIEEEEERGRVLSGGSPLDKLQASLVEARRASQRSPPRGNFDAPTHQLKEMLDR